MRLFLLLIALVCSPLSSPAQKKAQVGDWVLFRGTTEAGTRTAEITQRYAIVASEKDGEGTQLFWFETDIGMAGKNILTRLLVPASAFELDSLVSPDFYQTVRRWIVKMGERPAIELPPERAQQQVQALLERHDPDAKTTALGDTILETPKGKLRCAERRYEGKAVSERRHGPAVTETAYTYDRTIWHSDEVPIIGYARLEEDGLREVAVDALAPGAPAPPPQKTHTRIDLVDFGQGATSALTEDPVQHPMAE